jgi:hypothetical protein
MCFSMCFETFFRSSKHVELGPMAAQCANMIADLGGNASQKRRHPRRARSRCGIAGLSASCQPLPRGSFCFSRVGNRDVLRGEQFSVRILTHDADRVVAGGDIAETKTLRQAVISIPSVLGAKIGFRTRIPRMKTDSQATGRRVHQEHWLASRPRRERYGTG